MKTLFTKEEYHRLAASDKYYAGRWPYMSYACRLIDAIDPATVLEIGPYKRPMVPRCDTLDIHDRNLAGLTYKLDARHTPWPIADKQYDLIVCMQVMEHLSPDQPKVFTEIRRIAKHAVMSFPYWWDTDDKVHGRISGPQITKWCTGAKPASAMVIEPLAKLPRIVCHFNFSKI